ncbi:MAG: ABC transporter ATP-binding protein [Snodgrassella sp.]|uniref:ABC transporter ATP-binding protein n=1 Tax=Snodgrassella sp. TaxID=2815304 RepID=UPI002583912F|nr:ABC transporter ATP-binding protein [Snodgrassella sp.]MCO6508672.1 ABC transporter ATP-binding protein [Snodgrassella sp.]MCO6520218.1 ABC transporter ATP-binding protein [Snodgrassella sp.]MCO6525812.1 ABC transporter ATP-binding protein [Snodgrassella sp.]
MLSWQQVHKKFAGKVVAEGLSLQVADGELVAVLGESGSGKSTLLNMAAGLTKPDSGKILINDTDVTFLQPERRRIGLMFQDYALLPHLNVWQNVAFGLRMHGVSKSSARQQAQQLLTEVGLAEAATQPVGVLSGGERQRVALARALVLQPQALLLDEPFSALDTTLRASLQQLTLRLLRQQKCPTVLVTHSPLEAFALADRICLLRYGRWVQQGKISELLAQPADAWAARLLGCDNVSDTCYIPQNALQYDRQNGVQVQVIEVGLTARLYDVKLLHPQYGVLRWWLPLHQAVNAGDWLPLTVRREQVVFFQ